MIYSGQILEYNGIRYYQVNKSVARRLFEKKQPFAMQASNMRFNNPWISPFVIDSQLNDDTWYRGTSFDKLVNSFQHHNCDHKRGYYTHFFKQITPES